MPAKAKLSHCGFQLGTELVWHSLSVLGSRSSGTGTTCSWAGDRWSEAAPQQQVPSDVGFHILIFSVCSVMFSGGSYFHVGFLLRVAE